MGSTTSAADDGTMGAEILIRRRQVLVTVAGSLLCATGCATSTLVSQGVGVGGVAGASGIPEGFRTYSLFIGTSYNYSGLAAGEAAVALGQRFRAFGDAIGEQNLAVFVGDPDKAHFDVAAGRTLLDRVNAAYGIQADYQEGPFILVLTRHPSQAAGAADKATAIGFRARSAAEIGRTLGELQQELISARRNQTAGSPFFELLQGMLQGWRHTNNPLATQLAVRISASGTS